MKPGNQKIKRRAGQREAWLTAGICVGLVLLVLAVFGGAAHFGFVSYDDDKNVYENPVVAQGLSMASAGWAFTHAQVGNWIPLTTISHMADCQFFGLQAGGHHLVNVLWHAANAALLFLVLRQLTGSVWRSAFVAAVFAAHPLRAESVAWISERKDVLSGFFFLLTIGAYVRQVRRPSLAARVVTPALFALGLMAKSMVATLPLVLLLLDYWPLGRIADCGLRIADFGKVKASADQGRVGSTWVSLIIEKLPLLALAVGACLVAALMPGLVIAGNHRMPLPARIGDAVTACVIYVRQTIFPAGLAVPYPAPPNGRAPGTVVLALLALAAVTAAVWKWRKERPYLLVGWVWYLGMLSPVAGIIQILFDVQHADRYTYLPGIGLVMAGTWAVADWSKGWRNQRVVVGSLATVLIGTLAVGAQIQTSYWKDDETLWKRALAVTSGNSVAHNNLGLALAKKGEVGKAIEEFNEALKIHPDDYEVRYNLGVSHFVAGNLDEAVAQYRQALAIAPDNAQIHNNLGTALFSKGLEDAAIEQFRRAVELQPKYAEVHYNLGSVLAKGGKLEEAIAQFRQALEIKPDYADASNNLKVALFLKEQQEKTAVPQKP